MQQCFVLRDKGGLKRLNPVYYLYAESGAGGGGDDDGGGQLLLTARRQRKNRTSNYHINAAMHLSSPSRSHRPPLRRVAKLRANWSGSAYTVFDAGANPKHAATTHSGGAAPAVRRCLGAVGFRYDEMGPGQLDVLLPRVDAVSGATAEWRDGEGDCPGGIAATALAKHLEEGASRSDAEMEGAEGRGRAASPPGGFIAEGMQRLQNKRPKWNAAAGGHVLNFYGRVTQSSVKNFQLMCAEVGEETTVLQFGRVRGARERLTLDFGYPLSAVQAFAVCLASLDGKLADSKGFDAVTKLGRKQKEEQGRALEPVVSTKTVGINSARAIPATIKPPTD